MDNSPIENPFPNSGGGTIWKPGLEAQEVVNESNAVWVTAALTAALPAADALGFFDVDSRIATGLVVLRLAWPLLFLAFVRFGLSQRFRLVTDPKRPPEKLPDLLQRVALTPDLLRRLGPPQPVQGTLSVIRGMFPILVSGVPVYLLMTELILVMTALWIFQMSYYPVPYLLLAVALVFNAGAVPLLITRWVRRRAGVGVQVLGMGGEGLEDNKTMARFDEVQDAELWWDSLLGQPYLLLDIYGEKLRYYSPVNDRLHLLRLAKYRMPHLHLRINA